MCSVLLPVPAAAVTPEEVRDLLLRGTGPGGLSVTLGESRRTGDTLVLSDVILRLGDADGVLSQALPEMRLRDLGQGRVEVTAGPTASVVGRIDDADIRGTVQQDGLRLLIEGPPESPDATLSIDRLGVDLDVIQAGVPANKGTVRIGLAGLVAELGLDKGIAVATSLVVGKLSATAVIDGQRGSGDASLDLTGLALGHELTLTPELLAAIAAGPPASEVGPKPAILAGARAALWASLESITVKSALRGGDAGQFRFDYDSAGLAGTLSAGFDPDPVADGIIPAGSLDLALETAPGHLLIDFSNRAQLEKANVRSESGGLKASLTASLPPGLGQASFDDGPPRGLSALFSMSEAAGFIDFDVDAPDEPAVSGHARYEASRAEIGFDQTGLRYDVAIDGIDYALASPDLPVPFALSAPTVGIGFAMPLYQDAAPQPARLRIDLRDLRLSDGLWQFFDPESHLPRDPLRITLDAEAMLTVFGNLFNSIDDAAPPIRADSVSLKELAVTGLGAALGGSGAVTLAYPAGTDEPQPEGELNFRATGLNDLIDKVAKLGWVQPEDLTGLRMGLAFIAKPAGDGALGSNIRFGPGTSVVVNGVKMR